MIGALGVLLLGCDSFAGLQMRRAQLTGLGFADVPIALADSGVLIAQAQFLTDEVQLSTSDRIPLTWVTSRGDRETTGMWYAEDCLRGTPYAPFPCFVLNITLEAGTDPGLTAARVYALGAVLVPLFPGSRSGQVVVQDPRDLMSIAHELQSWREIRFVERGDGGPSCVTWDRCLASPIRLSIGPVRQRDGVLQVAVGDTVTLRYDNPSGATLTSTRFIGALGGPP